MKVSILTPYTEQSEGGEATISFNLATQLSKRYETAIICLGEENEIIKKDSLTLCKIMSMDTGLSGTPIPIFSKKNIRFLYNFLKDFSPDMFHAQNAIGIGLLGQIWAIRHRIPFIFTAHSLPSRILEFGLIEENKTLAKLLKVTLSDQYLKTFYNNCDCVIALNRFARDDIRGFGYKGPLVQIPNARDITQYSSCEFARTDTREKKLSYIGSIGTRKNQVYLINALSYLPENYKLHLIGNPFSEESIDKLRRRIPHNALRRTVFLGQRQQEEIPGLLQDSHVFVSASLLEVQSLVILEALASGTPVVGLSNETVDELIDEKVGYKFPQDTHPKIFAAKIREICELPQPKYEQICRSAKQLSLNFGWQKILPRYTDLYQQYIGQHRSEDDGRRRIDRLLYSLRNTTAYKYLEELFPATVSRINETEKKRTLAVPGPTRLFWGATVAASLALYLTWKITNRKKSN